jgi:putative membrane protein
MAMKDRQSVISIFLKGLLMGGADVIPGISGGTIAFITGIYERLISGLKDISEFIRLFIEKIIGRNKQSFRKIFAKIDFGFFLPLGIGIASAILIGSRIIPGLLQSYPGEIYAFFTGLILASAAVVHRKIKTHGFKSLIAGFLGLAIGYLASSSAYANAGGEPSLLTIMFVGFIAISAMLLPGLSGAFILVMLGQYEFMLNALRNVITMWPYVLVFLIGAGMGLIVFSRILSYLLKKHHSMTLYVLAGIMVGALYSPIGIVLEATYTHIAYPVLFFLAGMIIVYGIERVAGRKRPKRK